MQTSRGFLRDADLHALRARRAVAPFDQLWTRLCDRTRDASHRALAAGFPDSMGALAWHSHTPMLPDAALMVALDDDEEMLAYIQAAVTAMLALARERQAAGKKHAIHSFKELAIACDMIRDRLPADTRAELLDLMRIAIPYHAGPVPYVMYSGGGNVIWCQTVQAAVCALLWGEESGVADWHDVVHYATEHTRCYLGWGTDAGGYSYEGTGYGMSVFAFMYTYIELLALTGHADLYATEPRLRQIPEANLQRLFPDGSFQINDNDIGLRGVESIPALLWLAKRFDDPMYRGLWLAFQGPDHPVRPWGDFQPYISAVHGDAHAGPEPYGAMVQAFLSYEPDAPVTPVASADRPTCTYSPGTETINLRSSWSPSAVYVNLQGGGRSQVSQTHRHADAGHFSIVVGDEYLAIDTGRYNSDEDQHSVMIVDGECHRRVAPGWGMDHLSGRVNSWHSEPWFSHARVDSAHMKGCHWANRDVLFVPVGPDDAYIVTIDNINRDNAAHSFWWQIQAHHDATISIDAPDRARILGRDARLDLQFVWPGTDDFPTHPHRFDLRQDLKEWQWPYGREQKGVDIATQDQRDQMLLTSYRRPRLIGELEGLNGLLMAVISPRRGDQAPLTIRRHQAHRLFWIEIDHPLGTDTIIAAPDHGYIRTPAFTGLTQLHLARRHPDGTTTEWSLPQ